MADEQNNNENEPNEAISVSPCCEKFDGGKQTSCALCKKPTCSSCRKRMNGEPVCLECGKKIIDELENEKVDSKGIVMAAVGACLAAIISGAIWAVITISTGYEVGYVAIGVGWLAGMGALIGSGRKTGQSLQIISAAGAILGLLLAKYFMVAHQAIGYIEEESGEKLSYLDPEVVGFFFEVIGEMVSPWDLLWSALAIGAAWSICKPTELTVR